MGTNIFIHHTKPCYLSVMLTSLPFLSLFLMNSFIHKWKRNSELICRPQSFHLWKRSALDCAGVPNGVSRECIYLINIIPELQRILPRIEKSHLKKKNRGGGVWDRAAKTDAGVKKWHTKSLTVTLHNTELLTWYWLYFKKGYWYFPRFNILINLPWVYMLAYRWLAC